MIEDMSSMLYWYPKIKDLPLTGAESRKSAGFNKRTE